VDNTAVDNILAGLSDSTVDDMPAFRKGITEDPLFDGVESLLHIEIGVGNQLLKILHCIDMRLENIREDGLDIQDEYYEALMEYQIHDDRWTEWKNLKGMEIASLLLNETYSFDLLTVAL
jgi:hypothetical protein